ncbi:MAG: PH domain-containing protein [Planctomycetaceae bacterium]|nr:PH domain-containing protein [Planctomycetaceae bacterium]
MFEDARSLLALELSPGERLLWAGQPRKGLMFRQIDVIMIPFSLMFCGFAVFWEYMVLRMEAPLDFALFGLLFVAVGLYLLIGRYFVDAWQRARTFYGVTSDRILIISGIHQRSTRSIPLDQLKELSLTERSDGTGSVTLGPELAIITPQTGTRRPTVHRGLGPRFDEIEHVREVYEIIRAAQQNSQWAK